MDSQVVLKEAYTRLFEAYQSAENQEEILKKVLERGFVFQYDEDEKEADLLFIGINPSYIEQGKINDAYTKADVKNLTYFKAFEAMQEVLKNNNSNYNGIWTHIDLLVFRETEQNYIKTLMKNKTAKNFIQQQLQIAKERLIHIQPKIVVVANTQARKFMNNEDNIFDKDLAMNLDFVFDERFGAHKVRNIAALANTYFLFTSMLSGQRALDLGSRERLIWQIKNIFKYAF